MHYSAISLYRIKNQTTTLRLLKSWLRLLFISTLNIASVTLLTITAIHGADDTASKPRTSAKVLTIGNSFADNACYYLPEIAQAGGKDLFVVKANLGGHSLAQHVRYFQTYEANPNNPDGSPYDTPDYLSSSNGKKINLKDLLQSKEWTY
jgi:hypothetical protein